MAAAAAPLADFSSSSAASFEMASFSVACAALIACTASQVTPVMGSPAASVCVNCTSSGYMFPT
jgi:hypothetical protein